MPQSSGRIGLFSPAGRPGGGGGASQGLVKCDESEAHARKASIEPYLWTMSLYIIRAYILVRFSSHFMRLCSELSCIGAREEAGVERVQVTESTRLYLLDIKWNCPCF